MLEHMKIHILAWNVRGVNEKRKIKVIKALLKLQKVDLICCRKQNSRNERHTSAKLRGGKLPRVGVH